MVHLDYLSFPLQFSIKYVNQWRVWAQIHLLEHLKFIQYNYFNYDNMQAISLSKAKLILTLWILRHS